MHSSLDHVLKFLLHFLQFEKFVTVLKTVPMELSAMGIFNIDRRNIPAVSKPFVAAYANIFIIKLRDNRY